MKKDLSGAKSNFFNNFMKVFDRLHQKLFKFDLSRISSIHPVQILDESNL